MNFVKRNLFVFLAVLVLTVVFCVPASAASFESAAQDLSVIGMFRGSDKGFELDRAPTRGEAAIMLVRLYGAEEEALVGYESGAIVHPFTDVDYSSPYVAWLYSKGLANGTSPTTFGTGSPCTAQQYMTFLLRSLGYKDGTDFAYADAVAFAMEKGMFDTSMFSGTFLRDDLAAVTLQGLACDMKDGSTYLLDSLVRNGAVDAAKAERLTERIEQCKELEDAVQVVNNGFDTVCGIGGWIDLSTDNAASDDAGSAGVSIPVNLVGRIQMVPGDDPKMVIKMDGTFIGGEDGNSMHLESYVDNDYVYSRTTPDGVFKRASIGDGGNFNGDGEAYLSLKGVYDSQVSMLLPFMESFSKEISPDGGTVYDIRVNGAIEDILEEAFDTIINGLLQAFVPDVRMDVSVDKHLYALTYTIGADGVLKSTDTLAKFTLEWGLHGDDKEDASVILDLDLLVNLGIQNLGEDVQIMMPDLSNYVDVDGGLFSAS